MARVLLMVLGSVLVVLVLSAWHGYLWLRLVRDPAWPLAAARGAPIVLIVLAALIPVSMLLRWLLPSGVASPILYVGYTWLGVAFLLLVVVALGDLLRLVLWVGALLIGRFGGEVGTLSDPSRRLFLARAIGVVAAAVTGVASFRGLRTAFGEIAVRTVEVTLPRLASSLDGFTLVQLTDLHIGAPLGRGFTEAVAAKVEEIAPDAVAITGDLVDGSVRQLAADVAPLLSLHPPHGLFFVTGNHEYYSGAAPWEAHLRAHGVTVLDNARVVIGDASPGGAALEIAGVPDPAAARLGDGGPDVARALKERDPGRPVVLLAHQPKAIHEAARHGVDLVLAGHTHGGQIWPFHYLVALTQPYLAGLHRHRDSLIYVSRGTGFWGPPLRLGAPAEITRVVLRSEPAATALAAGDGVDRAAVGIATRHPVEIVHPGRTKGG